MNLRDAGTLNLLTALVWGEARGENLVGKVAVAWVVRNRTTDRTRWARSIEDVILQPQQFSCFNSDDPNLGSVKAALRPSANMQDLTWRECRIAAFGVLNGWIRDPTNGANHYHAVGIKRVPNWAVMDKVTKQIGGHVFYCL